MSLVKSLFQYKAWADQELYQGMIAVYDSMPKVDAHAAMQILHHSYTVDRIFIANLQRQPHGFVTASPETSPDLQTLFRAVQEVDQWYLGFIDRLSATDLSEFINFTFTSGAAGRISREEMLAHVLAHAGYHRGEVGQILTRLTGSSPRDTFTTYLQEVRPVRAVAVL